MRNVKYLTRVPTDRKTLFDDDEESQEIVVDKERCREQIKVNQPPIVRTRSGRISKPKVCDDYVYY